MPPQFRGRVGRDLFVVAADSHATRTPQGRTPVAKNKSNRTRRSRPLTSKQRTYFKLLCKGMPATQAARRAGYSAKNPAQSAYQAWQSIRERLQIALFEVGLTPEGLIHKHLLPALNAMETEFAKFNGRITETREVIAWGPRLRAMELVCELGGYFAPNEQVSSVSGELGTPKVIDQRPRVVAEGLRRHKVT